MAAKNTRTPGRIRKRILFKMEIHPAHILDTGRSTVTLRENGVTDVTLTFAVDRTLLHPFQIDRRAPISKQQTKEFCRELVKSLKQGLSEPGCDGYDGMTASGTIVVPRGAPLSFSFWSPRHGGGMHRFLEQTLAFVNSKFQDAEVKSYLEELKRYY